MSEFGMRKSTLVFGTDPDSDLQNYTNITRDTGTFSNFGSASMGAKTVQQHKNFGDMETVLSQSTHTENCSINCNESTKIKRKTLST